MENSTIIAFVIYTALIIGGLYLWKRNNDKAYLYGALAVTLALVVSVWEYISDEILMLSNDVHAVSFIITSAIRVGIVVALALILLRNFSGNKLP